MKECFFLFFFFFFSLHVGRKKKNLQKLKLTSFSSFSPSLKKKKKNSLENRQQDLFSPFGQVSRVYIAVDRETGESRGFGFVNFVYRADAQHAIDKLDGYGYDSLILRVEWAAPRAERP